MSLDFAIIPVTERFYSVATNIKTKLYNCVKLQLNVNIDVEYQLPVFSRINKWKKQDFDVITIDDNYNETGNIIVRFSDKKSRPEVMDIDEFIDLVASYDDDENDDKKQEQEQDKEKNVDDESWGCIIM